MSVQGALARHHVKIVAGGEQRGPGVLDIGVAQADTGIADLPDGGRDAARIPGRGRPGEGGAQSVVEAGQIGVGGEAVEHAVDSLAEALTGHR